jgi:galactosamine-6-phosphate isomerase
MKMVAAPVGARLVVSKDYGSMSRQAAGFIRREAIARPNLLVCVSGGASWAGCYEELGRAKSENPRLFRRVRVVQIDEWGGLRREDPATCRAQITRQVLQPLGVTGDRFAGFRSDPASPERECQRMQRWLAANGPIDLCLLGLGMNGHIALNEPAAGLRPSIHVVKLAASSLKSGMLKKAARAPRYGLTLGIGDILRSRKILMLVSGEAKRSVLKRLLEAMVTPEFPASFLWLHPAVTIICDWAALPTAFSRRAHAGAGTACPRIHSSGQAKPGTSRPRPYS